MGCETPTPVVKNPEQQQRDEWAIKMAQGKSEHLDLKGETELRLAMEASLVTYTATNQYRRNYDGSMSRRRDEARVKRELRKPWKGDAQNPPKGDRQPNHRRESTTNLIPVLPISGDQNRIPITVRAEGRLQHPRGAPLEKKIQIQYSNSLDSEWFSLIKTHADGNCLFHALCTGIRGQGGVWTDPVQLRENICTSLMDVLKFTALLDKIPIERYKLSYGDGYQTVLGTFAAIKKAENWQNEFKHDILTCVCKDGQYNCNLFDDLLVVMAVFIGSDIVCISQMGDIPIWSVYFASQIPTEKKIVVYHERAHYSAVLRMDHGWI